MLFALSGQALDVSELKAAFAENCSKLTNVGAIAYFEGCVRDFNEGRSVTALDYEVYDELTLSEGKKIVREAVHKFGLVNACCWHRSGKLALGEISVWIAAAASHRSEAFAACQYIIDEVKCRLPIWKKEYYIDGQAEWISCQHSRQSQTAAPDFSEKEFYERQSALPGLGQVGQEKLRRSRVLVIGAGGLGSPVLTHLAGAGIGQIDICDSDRLEVSNLHRQFLFSQDQIGSLKAELAADRIRRQNPFIKSTSYVNKLTSANAYQLFQNYDIILDCTDTLDTKLVVSESAIAAKIALISASVYRFEGQIHLWAPNQNGNKSECFYYGQCLRCLWRADEIFLVPTCTDSGILGANTGTIGSLQALEAIKHLLGMESPLLSHILLLDLLSLDVLKIAVTRNDKCTACGIHQENLSAMSKPLSVSHE
jgi:adenylyltransferase/sulfurtransferase